MLKDAATTLSMPAAVKVIELGWDEALALLSLNRPLSSHELQRVTNYADKVLSVFVAEASRASLLALPAKHADFLSPETPLFGAKVAAAFPSSAPDIADAGQCRA